LGENTITTTTTPDDQTACYGSASVNLTATVTPAPGGGTVQFYIDGSAVGSQASVISGVATFDYNPSELTSGPHTIRTDFSGYDDYLASTSNPGANKTLTIFSNGTWLGTTSNDWNTAPNWCGGVPTSSTNVIIPSGSTVHVTSSPASNAVCNNLTINAGGVLTIDAGKALTVNGTLTNNAGNGGLVIQSDATGTGSLNHVTPDVPATVYRYITGISQAWHLLSSPVLSQSISPAFTADPSSYDFFAWYEPENIWVNFKNTTVAPTWNTANGSTNFVVGKGYLVEYLASNPTKQFEGDLNSGNVNFTLFKSGTGTYPAFNLAGNPYPSAIDWKAVSGWTRNSLVLNGSGYDMSIWNDAVGNYGSFNSDGSSGNNGVTQYIAVGQGFMVKAASSGVLGMADEIRVHSDQSYLKSTDETPNVFRMTVSGDANTYSDEVVIEFGHQTDHGGAEKMFSLYETAPSLYTVKPTGNYSVDFRGEPGAVVIPVSFTAGADGNYTLSSNHLESFTSTTVITLEDLMTAHTQNLMKDPVYTFTTTKSGNEARFLLHFGGTFNVNDKEKEQSVNIYSVGNTVYIANNSGAKLKGEVIVYNMIGQPIMHGKLSEDPLTKIQFNKSIGYFLVSVITNENTYSGKIFLNY
jgi:hypothetical protein